MASEVRMRDRAGEFTELVCGLEWIAEQLMASEQEGPGAALKAIVERLSEYNEVLNTIQDGVVEGGKPDRVFGEVSEWLRQ